MAEFTIQFDFGALARAFSARICQILERSTFVLHAIEASSENPGILPNVAAPMIPPSVAHRPVDEVRADARIRVIRDAVRDCIEELAAFLGETRRLCAAVCLADRGTVTAEEWHTTVERPGAAFEGLGFPDKIKRLQQVYGVDILHESIDDLLTLNTLRNCLVHRFGVVTKRDCNDGDKLTVRWQCMQVFVRTSDGREMPLQPPQVLEGGDQIITRSAKIERHLREGDRVSLSETELSGIWFAFHRFSVCTAQRVEALARTHGFVINGPELMAGSLAQCEDAHTQSGAAQQPAAPDGAPSLAPLDTAPRG